VATRGKRSARSVDAWLIKPERPSGDADRQARPRDGAAEQGEPTEMQAKRPLGTQAAQWLVDQSGENGRATAASTDAETANASSKGRERPRAEPETKPKDDRELREARTALAEQQATIGQLEEGLAQRERDLAELEEAVAEREVEFEKTLKKKDAQIERLSGDFEKREATLKASFEQRRAELEEQLSALESRLGTREKELQENSPGSDSKESGKLDLNGVTFEQLRELGLSVTQSARVISCRETRGGFDSLEELEEVPGLPRDTRNALTSQLSL
jgi:DNA uptake protein ComE-like DNA-binding protein